MNESSKISSPSKSWILWLLCLAVLSFYEARLLSLFTLEVRDSHESLAMTMGEPGMKVWQNRIAGPYLVLTASKITGVSFAKCHLFFVMGVLFLSNLIPFILFRRVIDNMQAVYAFVLLNAAGLVAVHSFDVAHDFDLIDFCTLFIFAYGVFFNMPLRGFVLLFLVELLNREAAEFIALWLMIDGGISFLWNKRSSDLFKVGVGVFLIVAGTLWTQYLRAHLLHVDPHDEKLAPIFLGQTFLLKKTISDLLLPSMMLYTLLFILISVYARFAQYKFVTGKQALKVGILMAGMVTALALFTTISETRDWYEVVPFMVFLYLIPLGLAKGYK